MTSFTAETENVREGSEAKTDEKLGHGASELVERLQAEGCGEERQAQREQVDASGVHTERRDHEQDHGDEEQDEVELVHDSLQTSGPLSWTFVVVLPR